jgi:hypothetical protein
VSWTDNAKRNPSKIRTLRDLRIGRDHGASIITNPRIYAGLEVVVKNHPATLAESSAKKSVRIHNSLKLRLSGQPIQGAHEVSRPKCQRRMPRRAEPGHDGLAPLHFH